MCSDHSKKKKCMAGCFVSDWHLKIFYNFLEQNLKHQKSIYQKLKKKKRAITGQVFITFLSLLLRIIESCYQCYVSVQCSHHAWLLNEFCQAYYTWRATTRLAHMHWLVIDNVSCTVKLTIMWWNTVWGGLSNRNLPFVSSF